MSEDWQPCASLETLQARALLLRQIREFFYQRKVLEVETPLASHFGVTDVYLENLSVSVSDKPMQLQTSPEFAMKRLLAAGSGSIYQICKAFRDDECGRHHNPEFSLLEWYRLGYDHFQLMDEVADLITATLEIPKVTRLSYQQAFTNEFALNPHHMSQQQLAALVAKYLPGLDVKGTEAVQALFTLVIEPQIGQQHPVLVYDFPKDQASLAKCYRDQDGNLVAARFEAYYQGVELANGFFELQDAKEQQQRFQLDNQKRQQLAKATKPIDTRLIAALESGLPECSGVALGVDRLLMLKLQLKDIAQVMSFDCNRA